MIEDGVAKTTTEEPEVLAESIAVETPWNRFASRIVVWIDDLSARIAYVMETRPAATRATVAAFMIIALMFALGHRARAAGMMQDEINTAFNISTTFNIFDNSIDLAQYIFATLAALTLMVRVLAYYIRNQTITGLGQVILSSLLALGLPYVIIQLAPKVLPAISLVGLQMTDIITGNATSDVAVGATTPTPDAVQATLTNIYDATFGKATGSIDALTPKRIVDEGVTIALPLVKHVQDATTAGQGAGVGAGGAGLNGSVYNSNQMVLGFVLALAIGIIGAFVFIAVELVIAYLQIYLILPVAAFSLGFLGSPATRQFGSGYWVIVMQALLRFVTIIFVIGFAMSLSTLWAADVANFQYNNLTPGNGGVDSNVLKQAISAAAVSFSLLYIVRILPSLFASILTGMNVGAEGNAAEYQLGGAAQQGLAGRMSGAGLSRSGRQQMPTVPTVGRHS